MEVEKEIKQIKKRNQRVETDKAWEVSWTRRIVIVVLIYVVVVLLFFLAELPDPFLNSLVAVLAFVLSTLSLRLFRKFWEKFIYKNKK